MRRKEISLWRIAKRMGLFWALFVLAFGLIFSIVGGGMAMKSMTLARDGVTVTGTVLETEIRTRRDPDGSDRRVYHVTHRYTPEGQSAALVQSDTVSQRLFWSLEVGGPVTVTHARQDPEIVSIDLRSDQRGGIVFTSIGVLVALTGLGLTGWMIQRKLSLLRAFREGEQRAARITGLRKTNVRKNRIPQYVLDWVDATGATGSSMMDRYERLASFPVGSTIKLYIDPKTGQGWWDAQI